MTLCIYVHNAIEKHKFDHSGKIRFIYSFCSKRSQKQREGGGKRKEKDKHIIIQHFRFNCKENEYMSIPIVLY